MAFVLWMTGLPCSGKSTIARKLEELIPNLAVLDGDELREWLSVKDFSKEGRMEHNKKVAHVAKLLVDHNVPVCVSLVSPFKENRETARNIIGDKQFIETYVKCSLHTCEIRDTKGMYRKARNNELSNFTGIQSPYEEPSDPELILDTEKLTVQEAADMVISELRNRGLLHSEK